MLKNWILNIGLAIAGGLIIIWLVFVSLNWYTRHNVHVNVPNVKGQKLEMAVEKLEDAGLRFEVYDSVYDEDFKPDAVTEQDPPAGSEVKPNRIIYLSVNSLAKPKVKMPKLVDQSFALSKVVLKNAGLVLGNVEYKYDEIGKNLVIEQLYQGTAVLPGKMLEKGSVIDLVVATDKRYPSDQDSSSMDGYQELAPGPDIE